MTLKDENSESLSTVHSSIDDVIDVSCMQVVDRSSSTDAINEHNGDSSLQTCIDQSIENQDNDFERSFWFCNRRSFIRRHAHHYPFRRHYSTRSHDYHLFKRMCKVKPIKAKESKEVTDWKLKIEDFQIKKQTDENIKCYSKSLRSYYKSQDNLIEAYEELSKTDTNSEDTENSRSTEFYAKLSFFVNLFLLAAKATASILSGSIAIISSLVDSIVDLASGIVIWITSRVVRNCDRQQFPKGRKSLEPLAIIVLSVIMAIGSLELVNEAIQKVLGLANDTKIPPTVDVATVCISSATVGMSVIMVNSGLLDISAVLIFLLNSIIGLNNGFIGQQDQSTHQQINVEMLLYVSIKLVLYLICRKVKSPTVKALAQDHRNDILSNSLAVLCGYLGSQEFRRETNLTFMAYVDPIGAIIICLYIAVTWFMTGKTQARILTGLTAEPVFLSKVMWLCLNHHYKILKVQSVTAYHSGYRFITEVDVVLAEDISFKESRDIAATLQEAIESLEDVERAYVTTNYELIKKKLVEIQIG